MKNIVSLIVVHTSYTMKWPFSKQKMLEITGFQRKKLAKTAKTKLRKSPAEPLFFRPSEGRFGSRSMLAR